ncbi:MAG: HAD hydrolase family protein [Patescibacteria group bacterium]|nr:HAD hydrolase family protein [Patescibacteria group bacterium]
MTYTTKEELLSLETENLISNSTAYEKLNTRITEGKTPALLALDVDGTVYTKKQNPATKKWIKDGDNAEISKQMKERSIPLVLVSGRPDWDNKAEHEMGDYRLMPADIIIAGAGSIIYWRNKENTLVLDRDFLNIMQQQQIVFKQPVRQELLDKLKESSIAFIQENEEIKALYNPQLIQMFLSETLFSRFEKQGLTSVKVDNNQGIGLTTLDISNMSFDNLRALISEIRNSISGVKIEYSEDLEHISGESFTGWVQIIPQAGGKDKALRYVLEKLAYKVNPYNVDSEKKPIAYCCGDASIDIWMLAMGAGKEDSYKFQQFLLGNATPNARTRLEKVAKALAVDQEAVKTPQSSIEKYFNEIRANQQQIQKLQQALKQAKNENDFKKINEIEEELKKLTKQNLDLQRMIRVLGQLQRGSRRANLTIINEQGPDGVRKVVSLID